MTEKEPEIAMIAAVAENNVIGTGEGIPWRIPSDFAFFRRMTMGKPMIMGRKQFETVGKPLPGRTNIVISRQADYQPEGVIVIHDFGAALEHAKAIAKADLAGEVMIIGGGEIYRLGMPVADRLYISHVALRPEGEVTFPDIDPALWERTEVIPAVPSEKDSAGYTIAVYERRLPDAH